MENPKYITKLSIGEIDRRLRQTGFEIERLAVGSRSAEPRPSAFDVVFWDIDKQKQDV